MMNPGKCKVLNEFTIRTISEIIQQEGAELTERITSRIQGLCHHALSSLDTYPDIKGIRSLLAAYEELSVRDRAIIAEHVEDYYTRGLRAKIRNLHDDYRGQLDKVTGRQADWEEADKSIAEYENVFRKVSLNREGLDCEYTAEEKFIASIKPFSFTCLPESKGKKPPSIVAYERRMLISFLWNIYVDELQLPPIETKQGAFWCFLETILTDPSMEVFTVGDIRAEIRKKKASIKIRNNRTIQGGD